MWRLVVLSLLAICAVGEARGQMVQRAWVGFDEFFYEVPWTNGQATVELSCGTADQEYGIEVWYETVDGTAVAGRDYVAVSGSHFFPAFSEERTVRVTVPLLTGSLEEDKFFRIRVTRADFPSEVSRSRGDVPIWITGRPRLTVWMWEGDIHLRWRASATNLVLEASSALEGEPWLPVEEGEFTPVPFEPSHVLRMPVEGSVKFFRLKEPTGGAE